MQRKDIVEAVKHARANGKKRKFDQSVELILNFKGIDFKKAENRIDLEVKLPHGNGKLAEIKALAFVKESNFAQEIKGKVARIIMDNEIANLKKKEVDQLMLDYNVFVAEGAAMLTVGRYLGQMLAPKGRMPKPIQGTLQALDQAVRGSNTVMRVTNKKGKFMPVIYTMIGKESFTDEAIADNVLEVYNAVLAVLPTKEGNLRSTILKFTMGAPVKIGAIAQSGDKQ